jgi:hypothetical protein
VKRKFGKRSLLTINGEDANIDGEEKKNYMQERIASE